MIKTLLLSLGLLAAGGCSQSDESEPVKVDGARVVYSDAQGRVVKLEDLNNADGNFKWEVIGGKPVPPKADELHQRARTLGSNGDLKGAVELLKQASALAPEWPYPPYDLAYTYMLMGRTAEALPLYEEVDRLEPRGFFTAKTAVWALRKEKEGVVPTGTYLSYLKIEWEETDQAKLALARRILEIAPHYALALKECALRATDEKEKAEFIEKSLAASPDPETYGVLLINKAIQLDSEGKHAEAIKILGELVLTPESTLGNVAMAKSVMRLMVQNKK